MKGKTSMVEEKRLGIRIEGNREMRHRARKRRENSYTSFLLLRPEEGKGVAERGHRARASRCFQLEGWNGRDDDGRDKWEGSHGRPRAAFSVISITRLHVLSRRVPVNIVEEWQFSSNKILMLL